MPYKHVGSGKNPQMDREEKNFCLCLWHCTWMAIWPPYCCQGQENKDLHGKCWSYKLKLNKRQIYSDGTSFSSNTLACVSSFLLSLKNFNYLLLLFCLMLSLSIINVCINVNIELHWYNEGRYNTKRTQIIYTYIHTYLYMHRNIPTHGKILKIRNEDSASEGTDPCTIFTIL